MKRNAAVFVVGAVLTFCCACGSGEKQSSKDLDQSKEVTLTICGPWTSCKAIENVSRTFYEKYPNCNVEYEYVQNYEESMVTRLKNAPDTVDLFLTENIQADSSFFDYAEELLAHPELDLSDTNDALIKNFKYLTTEESEKNRLYSIPLGGDLRGMFVNKTLLNSLNLEVPFNREELLNACQVLQDAGYVPLNGNPGMFGQRLLYPYVANLIANAENYEETYERVNTCGEGVSELFRDPLAFMYQLCEKRYYNYKYVETELNMFTDNSDEGCARYFFHVEGEGNDFTKVDDLGIVPFMIGTLAQQTMMEKTKEDYHSGIDYAFILSPVSDQGGFAYSSPAKGIGVNKNSENTDWAIEFLNYLFSEDVNTQFAADINYIPNTKDSFSAIREQFDVPDDQICDLGQVTFDYAFYNIIDSELVTVSKSNNPKYMDTDKEGNPVMFSFDSYMEELENAFQEQRKNGV